MSQPASQATVALLFAVGDRLFECRLTQSDALPKVGDEVEITYRLGGRKWQRDAASEVKYFLSCEATNFRVLSGAAGGPAADEFSSDPNSVLSEAAYEDDEDVPF